MVYIPTQEEIENRNLVNFKNLNKKQVNRIYKMVSCTGVECFFIPMFCSKEIIKNENGTNNKNQRIQKIHIDSKDEKGKPIMIKKYCWKLKTDRIGNIIKIIK